MNKIQLTSAYGGTHTSVSNIFIDQYMPAARGEYVKVYLYLLRCAGSGDICFSVSDLADLFDHTENDIVRSLRYWERQGLLRLTSSDGQITGIELLPVTEESSADTASIAPVSTAPEEPAAEAAPPAPVIPEKKQYSAEEVSGFSQNPDIQELFFIIQTYLRHPLSATDTNTILYWYDTLGFPADLIEYLVEYCISKGHSGIRYMDKVALGWAGENIRTVEQARDNAAIHSQLYYAVMKALGIHGRNLVPAENEYLRKWSQDYGFTTELIQEACARTISATHQPSFEYTDSILKSWHTNNVHSPADIAKLDEAHSRAPKKPAAAAPARNTNNRFNNFNQRSYDEDQLEQMLLNSSPQ